MGTNSLYGPLDPAPDAGYADPPPRMGFFTDTSICIGCKACEVACKEWNGVPDRVHPIWTVGRAARARPGTGRTAARVRRARRAALRPRPARRGRRHRRLLPAPRRAGGLRPATRPGGHPPRPDGDVA